MLLGIDIISPLVSDWHADQLALAKRGKFTVGKVQVAPQFATAPENVEQLIDVLVPGPNGRKTIILRTDDAKFSAADIRQQYVSGGFDALVGRRADVDWYLEVSNEANLAGVNAAQQAAMFRDAITLKGTIGHGRLSWLASLPTDAAALDTVLPATKDFDGLACHWYSWTNPATDSGGGDWKAILARLLTLDRAVWITEIGIDDTATAPLIKAQRILAWLDRLPPRVVGGCIFTLGSHTQWPQYELTPEAADFYGKRSTSSAPPVVVTPPAKPPITVPPVTNPPPPANQGEQTVNYGGITNLVDIRKQLRTNPNGGPNQRVALNMKTGIVVHYNGPPVQQSALAQLKGDAVYHCQEIWGYSGNGQPLHGDGIMYHLGISEDGTAYLMRDFEQVLWHCAAWPQNGTALSVTIPIGDGQHATKAALATLKRICDEWRAAGHGAQVWGHQELSPTSCPGTLMTDFVYPYRAGNLIYEEIKPMATYVKFDETGHGVGGGFLSYFQKYGGVRIFGFPLTEEVTALGEDGKPVTVQYFERARFEWRDGQAPADYDVTLSRLGANQLAADQKAGVVK